MVRKRKSGENAKRRMMTWVGVVVLTVGIAAAGAVVGVAKLWRAVANMPEFRADPSLVEFAQPWVQPDKMRADFARTDPTGLLSAPQSIFASGLAERTARAYAASPWVRAAPEVRKAFPNRLDIRLDLREPFAVVAWAGQRCCLDRDGVVLSPTLYRLTPDFLATLGPELSLPDDLPPPIVGSVWDDATVRGGLEMLRLCREQFDETVGVARIEIAAIPDAYGMRHAAAELVLAAGSRVTWGRAPAGPASLAEISTEQKAEALRALVRDQGNNLSRLGAIDVRWRPTVIRRSASETAP